MFSALNIHKILMGFGFIVFTGSLVEHGAKRKQEKRERREARAEPVYDGVLSHCPVPLKLTCH